MRIIDKMRRQTACYWKPTGTDDQGDPTYADPVELRVRWQDSTEQVMTAAGETVVSKAVVFTGEDVEENGVLWLGTLDSLPDPENPLNNPKAFQIVRFDKIPTLRADDMLRMAYL